MTSDWHRTLRYGAATLFSAAAVGAAFLVARRITNTSWPLAGAKIELVFGAAAAYLASFGFRALGWQRLFPAAARPDRSRCLAACGAAAASGVVLPFRLDYVVKIATLRRLSGVKLGLDAIAISILSLGLVDAVAVLVLGPQIGRLPLIARSQRLQGLCGRVGGSAARTGSTFAAGGLLLGCWLMRALGNTFLLWALGVGFSPAIALLILCLAAAASILPITAGGAIAGVGATSGILIAIGVPTGAAVNFSLASGLLLTSSALVAAVVGVSGSVLFAVNRRRLVRAAAR